jgi:hypothetical protein
VYILFSNYCDSSDYIHDLRACYIRGRLTTIHFKKLLSFNVLNKNVNTSHGALISSLVFMGVKLGLTLSKERRVRDFENRVLWRMRETGEN